MSKVLVFGEQSHMLALLSEKFIIEGFEVVTLAADVSEISRVRLEQPDLIVLDQHLGNDPHFMKRLKQQSQGVPIIILSARTASETSADRQTRVAYMKLPFKPSQLVALARQQLY